MKKRKRSIKHKNNQTTHLELKLFRDMLKLLDESFQRILLEPDSPDKRKKLTRCKNDYTKLLETKNILFKQKGSTSIQLKILKINSILRKLP